MIEPTEALHRLRTLLPRSAAALTLVLTLLAAPLAAQFPTFDEAEDAPAQTELLQLRHRVALRDAATAQQRLGELRGEIESARHLLDDETFDALMELTDREALERADPATTPPEDADELAEAVAAARELRDASRDRLARTRELLEPHRTAMLERRFQTLVDRVAEETAALRGLELKSPVDARVLEEQALRDLLDELIDAQLTPERLRGEGLVWIVFDLIPPDTDLRLLYANLMEEQVGGLYDDREGVLYVVDTFDPFSLLGGVILSHEITHALQDMHFPIHELPFRTGDGDQDLATAAVLEGDATLLMIDWMMQNARPRDFLQFDRVLADQAAALETVPPALVQGMIFPYMAGTAFFQGLQGAGIEDWRDRPFRDVPRSTAQILHPDRYLAGEDPVEVPLPGAETAGEFEQVYRGKAGQWMTRLILTPQDEFPSISFGTLDPLVSDRVAVEGSTHWAGDALAAFATADDSEWFVAWRLSWRSDAGTRSFADAFSRRVASREGFDALKAEEGSDLLTAAGANGERVVLTTLDGRTTEVILASGEEALTAAKAWLSD